MHCFYAKVCREQKRQQQNNILRSITACEHMDPK
jgi:hypothetical protein